MAAEKGAFRLITTHPRLATVPKVIQTPKYDNGHSMDPIDLRALRGLARPR